MKSAQTLCGEEAETTIVTGAPRVKTQVSDDADAALERSIRDKVIVTGLGAARRDGEGRALRPVRRRAAAIICERDAGLDGIGPGRG